jgi:hypothetical protein
MPPRFAYWTIILEGKPTAFRAQHREDLVPTFKQLQSRHPDATMMWFGRGRLWASPEDARAAARRPKERRQPDWRPGGEHRDPRARFEIPRDEKRRRFAAKLRRDRQDHPTEETGSVKGPSPRPASPHRFSPNRRGEDQRERPKRFAPKAWKDNRGRGSQSRRGGGGRGGGQSR